MAATFTYTPSRNFSKSNKPRVLTTQFGEGYAQRFSEGLNTINNKWSLQFITRSIAEAQAIDTFFLTAGTGDPTEGGKSYFFWTPPGEATTYRVICDDWNIEYTSVFSATITATFTRVFEM